MAVPLTRTVTLDTLLHLQTCSFNSREPGNEGVSWHSSLGVGWVKKEQRDALVGSLLLCDNTFISRASHIWGPFLCPLSGHRHTSGFLIKFQQSQKFGAFASAPQAQFLLPWTCGSKRNSKKEKQKSLLTIQGSQVRGEGGNPHRWHAKPLLDETPFRRSFLSVNRGSVISVWSLIVFKRQLFWSWVLKSSDEVFWACLIWETFVLCKDSGTPVWKGQSEHLHL